MGRSMFDDITPARDTVTPDDAAHSIRDVAPLATQERSKRRARRAGRRQLPNNSNQRAARKGRMGVWIVAIAIFVLALSTIGFVFIGKTTITIIPQQETISVTPNVVYTAYRNAESGELGFTIIEDTLEATDSIPATGSELVKEKASGRITVYNTYSTNPQRLIKNTRFESPAGDIYRIRDSLTVPGKNTDGTPGSIDVTVYADIEGADQNISDMKTKFSIPGLKGDPRFDAFYAQLKEPIAGGFVGERAVVDQSVLNATQTKLRAQLQEKVTTTLTEKVPENSIIFTDGIFTQFESSPIDYTDQSTATVREVARVYAVAFNQYDFAHMLALTALAAPAGGDILIDNPDAITMSIVNRAGVDITSDSLIQFTLEGPATLTWQVDTTGLKQDLVGKHREALNTVMAGYPGIKSAQATIRPYWKKEYPTDPSNITVDIVAQ